jgi:predicted double-glycine peptidase
LESAAAADRGVKSSGTAVLVLAAMMAAGPGTALPFSESPVRSLLEARHHNVVMQEWDTSCGAAALATLLRYQLGDPVTERTVALGMLRKTDPDRVRYRGGFSLLDMKRYAELRGFAAEGYADVSAGQLMRLAPAIVPIQSNSGDHFVVFRGVVNGQAVIADPAFGNRSLPFAAFESRWKDRLAFVVSPARGRKGNRLFASKRDVLRVEDDASRRGMDETLPRPLSDAQLALAFAVDTPSQLPPLGATPGGAGPDSGLAAPRPGTAAPSGSTPIGAPASPALPSPSAAGPTISAPTPVASLAPGTTLPGTTLPSTTLPSTTLPGTTLPGTTTPIVITAPVLPPVSISPPSLPLPGVTVPTAPTLPPIGVPGR